MQSADSAKAAIPKDDGLSHKRCWLLRLLLASRRVALSDQLFFGYFDQLCQLLLDFFEDSCLGITAIERFRGFQCNLRL